MRKLYALMLTGLASLGLSAQSPSPYCGTPVYHFENTAEVASEINLSVGYDSPNTIFVEIESNTADAVDLLIVNSNNAGPVPGAIDSSVAGKYRTTYTWTGPVDTASINVIWSKRGMPGNWQLIAPWNGNFFNQVVTDTCGGAGYAPQPGNITFSVDMNQYTGSFTTVYVSGTFNGWDGVASPLADPDMDGVWEGTVPQIAAGNHEYKFQVDAWTADESLIAGTSCTVTNGGFTNRSLTVDGDAVVPEVCWEACTNCASAPQVRNVTFRVDMTNYQGSTANGVFVNGTFNGWCGSCNPMTDMGNGLWEVTLPLTSGTIEYKFTVDGWNAQENFSPGGTCTVTNGGFTNRVLTFTQDVTLPSVCWDSCNPCTNLTTKNVTFTVDMSDYTGSTANGVFVNGDFNGWCGACAPMTDMGGGIWQLTAPVTADSMEYKFTVDGWNDQENFVGGEPCTKSAFGFTNRFAVLSGDTAFSTVCWNSCTACQGIPTSVNVTFKVDMSEYPGSWTDVNLNGTFNGWCGTCAPMSDVDGDSIYELVVNVPTSGFEYKFTVDGWTAQENLDTTLSCVLTTAGFTNRYLMPTADTVMPAVCWESCDPCGATPPAMNYNITLSVNMNAECDYDSVHVAGDFNSWSGMGHSMMDMGNGIYTATISMPSGSNDYKFRKWVNGMSVMESISNRNLNVTADATHSAVCFNNVANCDGMSIDSVSTVNFPQGVFMAHWSGLPTGATSFQLQWREQSGADTTWRSKGANNPNVMTQKFNITPWFNANVEYRLMAMVGGSAVYSCTQSMSVGCKPMTVQTAEQNAATCVSDTALVRVGYAGGRGAKTILWSNGSTVKRTYADQGEKLYVTVTDDRGCSVMDSVTASVKAGTAEAPSNVATTRSAAVVTVTWDAASLGTGQSLIGYRVQYRLRGTQSWTSAPITSNLTDDVDFSAGPSGNYDFTVVTRYNDNGTPTTSAQACREVRGIPAGVVNSAKNGGYNFDGINVYPNPASTELNVEAASGSSVDLLDLNGRMIASQEVEGSSVRFDMSDLASGVYMVRVQTGDNLVTERVIKQ